MGALRTALEDIRKRQNLGTYGTILLAVFAIVVTVLDTFGTDILGEEDAKVIGTATLAILAYLLWSLMEDRREHKETQQSLSQLELEIKKSGMVVNFTTAINEIVGNRTNIERLDFFGATSALFQPQIRSMPIRIKHARILLRNPANDLLYCLPKSPQHQARLKQRVKEHLDGWRMLHLDKRIQKLDLRIYDFDPSFVLAIINGTDGFWCLFQHREMFPFNNVDENYCFILRKGNRYQEQLLQRMLTWYNNIFDNYCVELPVRAEDASDPPAPVSPLPPT